VTHLHGELTTMLCDNCFRTFSIGSAPIAPTLACPRCGDVEPVKPEVVFFGGTSPGYHILAEELERLRVEDILIIIGTSLRVIPVDMLVPSWRAGDELVWQLTSSSP
jgi:NAD-dependent deacetylase